MTDATHSVAPTVNEPSATDGVGQPAPPDAVKVLYDVSLLARAHANPAARTGIFRVAEEVACALASREDVELALCAAQSWEGAAQVASYLRATPALWRVPLVMRSTGRRTVGAAAALLTDLEYRGGASVLLRATRVMLRTGVQAVYRVHPPIRWSEIRAYDVFHSPFYALPARRDRQPGVKYFLTVHDILPVLFPAFFTRWQRGVQRRILANLQSGDYVIAVSESTKRDLCERCRVDPAHVFVVYNAASPDVFFPVTDAGEIARVRARYGVPDGATYVLSVNTLEPRKNVEHALRSFVRLVQQEGLENLYFVLVGPEGWDRSTIQALSQTIAGSAAARERVIVTGYIPDEDLAALYSGAVLFLYPSLYEGFGLPVLEAMQCGVPVIASNRSSLPEVVGDAGIMVEPTDGDALCQAMLDLYRDRGRRRELAAKASARAATFSWDRCAAETVAAYQAAMAGA